MKTNLFMHARPLALGCLLTVFLGDAVSQAAELADLADFGYNTMRMEGAPATNTRPLVVVLVDFDTAPPFGHTNSYYDSFFFSSTNSKGIQGFFRDNSRGRFNWVRAGAGVVGPVPLAATDRAYSTATNFEGEAYDTNMVFKVMKSGVFDFRSYDTNGDKRVTANELTIVFISNDEWPDTNCPTCPFNYLGANRTWQVYDTNLDYSICHEVFTSHKSGLQVTAHELGHALGAMDCYSASNFDGACSQNLTVMSFSPARADDNSSVHFDPWHKMRLGWCEPRIFSLPAGGKIQLPAAQIFARPDAPLLLYDPLRGTNDYFLLEFRNPFLPDSPYDANLAYNFIGNYGLVIWHVGPLPGSGVPVAAEGPTNLTRGSSYAWSAGALTPHLKWLDGSSSPATVSVWPFGTNDNTITVEWLADLETWVDFNIVGVPELGTFDAPYNTFAEGVSNVSRGGTLFIKTGHRDETNRVDKRMTLRGYNGPASIGK